MLGGTVRVTGKYGTFDLHLWARKQERVENWDSRVTLTEVWIEISIFLTSPVKWFIHQSGGKYYYRGTSGWQRAIHPATPPTLMCLHSSHHRLVKSTQLQIIIIDWIMRKSFCLRLTLCWTATTTTGEAELKGFKSDFPALTILRKSSSLSWKTFNYFSAHFSHFFGPHFDGAVERRRQTRIPKLSPTPGELTRQSRAGPGRQTNQWPKLKE